jgi:futalosine hydrolase
VRSSSYDHEATGVTDVLLVAATERELCGHDGLVCGVGPVEAAAATARALVERHPDAVLHVGVAGGSGLETRTLIVGAASVYSDIRAAIPVVDTCEPDVELAAAVRAVLPDAPFLPILTTARVSEPSGSVLHGAVVEAMEGFAVLRACVLAGVAAVEVRAISNEIGERNRSRWEVDAALAALGQALPRLLDALRR